MTGSLPLTKDRRVETWTPITVTALQPAPTDTDFFQRAGMDDTEVGQKGRSESQPDDVARQGIDALLAG
jgi:short-subunit dehydrogenase